MAEVAKMHQDQLERIKKNIENWHLYFQDNCTRWHSDRRFIYETTLSEDERSLYSDMGKPILEFPVLVAYVNRLKGEFSKQEPNISVKYGDDEVNKDPILPLVIEGHFREAERNHRANGTAVNIYDEQLTGGFSAIEVYTEYAHEMSMNQIIKFNKVFEPTLCGWDPLAMETHKGDGQYCFKHYPYAKEEFEVTYPKIDISEVRFQKKEGSSFNWSFKGNNKDILILCDYYEKKKKKVKIVQPRGMKVMTQDEYDKMVEEWDEMGPPPAIVGKPRMTTITTICRYVVIENQVIEYEETDYPMLPLVFVDGNSAVVKDSKGGNSKQITLSYHAKAKDTQRLKNLGGISLAHELSTMMQHKIMVARESIPPQYLDAYKKPQRQSVLVYNAFLNDNPQVSLPPPTILNRTPIPPEYTTTFKMADETTQVILGSYDASLGINNNQLSGVAIVEGATQSNATAMPYIVNYMKALQRVADIIIKMIPKYYVTPRTIPVLTKENKREFVPINQPGGINLDYDQNSLGIEVEAGVNFEIQKNRTLEQLTAMAQAMPIINQLLQEPGALKILLHNMDIRDKDQLEQLAEQFIQQLQSQQSNQQPNPLQMKIQNEQMNIQREQQKDMMQARLKEQELQLKQQEINNDRMGLVLDAHSISQKHAVDVVKAAAENNRSAADLALKTHDMMYKHAKYNPLSQE